ncbi:MAG TPA: hypothetical protein VII13_11150 [Vicinamibacteria bacterium]|jgi:hypothetical protein
MSLARLDRRTWLRLLLAAAAGACQGAAPTRRLAARLGLDGGERGWLAELTPGQAEALLGALDRPLGWDARAAALVVRLFGSHERLLAFLREPFRGSGVCDGLLRE